MDIKDFKNDLKGTAFEAEMETFELPEEIEEYSNDRYEITSDTIELTPEEVAGLTGEELRSKAIEVINNLPPDPEDMSLSDLLKRVNHPAPRYRYDTVGEGGVLKEAREIFNRDYLYDKVIRRENGGVNYTIYKLGLDKEVEELSPERFSSIFITLSISETPKEEQK